MAGKMWAGRFTKEVDERVNDFNSSISFDARMYRYDIEGSMAHATMLGECGIIEKHESEKIVQGLKGILADIDEGKLQFDPTAEDVHMFVEAELTKRLGDTGKRLHTARSRNDQVALDVRMILRAETKEIIELVKKLEHTILDIAEKNLTTVMPGYTHLQRAQPITFAHHLMAYANMLLRDISRLEDSYKRTNIMPLGSGALACSWEFKFIELDDAYATGSSIMPQKKNPDVTELIRGKTGRVYGDLNTLLVMMKGLPLAYNKDMQEDKEAIFDAIDTVKLCLKTFDPMLATMRVIPENMRNAAAKGFINATDCADYLVKKGMPFRDAYKITGTLVHTCIEKGCTLETLPLEEYKKLTDNFDEDVYDAISLDTCVMQRKAAGGPAPESVKAQIEYVRNKL